MPALIGVAAIHCGLHFACWGGLLLMNKLKISWTISSPPNENCPYNHTIAETPFGRFLLTWKAWKEDPDYGFDETPWGKVEYHGWNTAEEAKEWAEKEMTRRCEACFEEP